MRAIVLDTETTGFDPNKGDRIIEIGAVEVFDGVRTGEYYHQYIRCDRESSAGALKVHGITTAFLKDKPRFGEVMDGFLEFIADSDLVIHNAGFDMKFLNYELGLQDKKSLDNKIIDTLIMARKKFPGSPATLDALCKRFDIDSSIRVKHGALLDSELLAEVYLELIGGKQRKLEFDENKNVQTSNEDIRQQKNKVLFPHREFQISTEEGELHKKMLKKIKGNLWSSS